MKLEEKIQQEICVWFNNNYCLKHHSPRCAIYSVPNESKSKSETLRKMAMGMKPGVSDLHVILPGKILFVEVKTPDGRQSKSQIEFENIVSELDHNYYIVRSLEEFNKIIEDELRPS